MQHAPNVNATLLIVYTVNVLTNITVNHVLKVIIQILWVIVKNILNLYNLYLQF